MVVFEEFDRYIEYSEHELLSLLDGQNQKENIIYMATTNFIDKIPARIRRPGRMSTLIEVKAPIAEARKVFIQNKCGNVLNHLSPENMDELVAATDGLTIDELKEFLQSVVIFKEDPDVVLARLKEFSNMPDVWLKAEDKEDEDY
jgi:SpoVK/Ycf46/Vps4 family AAA+-type ATPase